MSIYYACPKCKQKSLVEVDGEVKCLNNLCDFSAKKCPICNGYLVRRNGTPDFWGCSNYYTSNCKYIEKII